MGLINYIDIDWPDLFKPILTSKSNFFNRIRVNREVIPIIFVPGTMGSRLKNKITGESVWDPDRRIMIMLRKYGGYWNTPAQRKRMLIGDRFKSDYLEVNEKDTKHARKYLTITDSGRYHRGWGGVFWSCYGKFLEKLQHHKWDKPEKSNNEMNSREKELIGKCFEFPVYAFGYNWTDSNENTGNKLAAKIDEIIKGYKKKGRLCKHVILISHSMGGLVCRSACCDEIGKAELNNHVLGVIHGVQPATGAAAAYWRIKAGFERTGGVKSKASAWVLGTNGEEVTCILGNAPGGLELLPNKHYTNNKGEPGWLRVPRKDGKEFVLPRNGDPYKEIYKIANNVFWRLINPDWLEPRDKRSEIEDTTEYSKTPWEKYNVLIDNVNKFHRKLKTDCHKQTYQFYSRNLKTVDKIRFSREKLLHIKKQHEIYLEFGDPISFETTKLSRQSTARGTSVMYVDNNEQEIESPLPESHTTHVLTMAHVKDYIGGGDGTVPDSSGNALKKVLHSHKLDGVEHQEAYGDEEAINFVFSAIRNLALKRIKEGEVASAR